MSPKESKINSISPLIIEIRDFYLNYQDITFEQIKNNLDIITDQIPKDDMMDRFKLGFIFLD